MWRLCAPGLPRSLSWLGIVLGAAGVVSVVPALRDLGYAFGMLQIVWFVWVGVVMLPWAASASLAWRSAGASDRDGSRAYRREEAHEERTATPRRAASDRARGLISGSDTASRCRPLRTARLPEAESLLDVGEVELAPLLQVDDALDHGAQEGTLFGLGLVLREGL